MIDRENESIAIQVAAGLQPVREIAEQMVAGHVFTDEDALRVARAFLDAESTVNPCHWPMTDCICGHCGTPEPR